MNISKTLPDWLRDLLTSPPRAGEGVHHWLFRTARQLHAHYLATEIIRLLETQVANCGRSAPRSEIVAAVQNSISCAWEPTGKAAPAQTKSKWPGVNQSQREAIIRDGSGLADLWQASSIRLEDNTVHTEEFIDR